MACHTAQGGEDFAGGYAIVSDMGTIWSTNITPDKDHGIGNYTFEDFDTAMRKGVRPDGRRLYPAMPYPSYAKITDADMKALYAYFMDGVKPVATSAPETDLGFPSTSGSGCVSGTLRSVPRAGSSLTPR